MKRDGERGCLLGLLHSDSSINTWDSDKDDGFGGDRPGPAFSRLLIMALKSSINEPAVCVCVSKMSVLPRFDVFYGRSVHFWDKRQIHLCLVFDGHRSGHYFCFWCACILRLLSKFLKSAASFTRYITIPFCLLLGWNTATLYCNLMSRLELPQPLFLFCSYHHLYLDFFQISLGGLDWVSCMTVKS